MDPVMIEKLHAMKRYKSRRNRGIRGFLLRLLRLALSVIFLGLFLSSPLWIPRLMSTARDAVLFLAAAPSLSRNALLGPACLFVLCNVIVVLLVGESKMGGEKEKVVDIYDEYARRVGSAAPVAQVERVKVVEEEVEQEEEEEEEEEVCEDYGVEGVLEEEVEEDEETVLEGYLVQEDVTEDEGEDDGLPAAELNRKVEDFIAYTQRRWEQERKMQEGTVSYRSYRGWAD